jgi:pectate lyase-like protein
MTVLDSTFQDVEDMLIVGEMKPGLVPNVVLDNVRIQGNSKTAVSDSTGKTWLAGGARTIDSWATGMRYTDEFPEGNLVVATLETPRKPKSLLHGENWNYFTKDKPIYDNMQESEFINIIHYGVKNDGSYSSGNAKLINNALRDGAKQGKVVVFPAGTYKVDDTIFIPPGSRLVGALWSQIMATGKGFSDPLEPKVLAKLVQKAH